VIAIESVTVSDMTYAVHTATCTYMLDEDGVCRWTHAPLGVVPPGSARCVGAQFVACLDLSAEGGLVGELRLEAAALFVRQEGDRLVLLRTLPIEAVEIRPAVPSARPAADPHSFAETPIMAQAPFPAFPFPEGCGGAPAGAPEPSGDERPPPLPEPPPPFNPEETAPLDPRWSSPGDASDLEELLSISITEVTRTLPLYRPPQPAKVVIPPLEAQPSAVDTLRLPDLASPAPARQPPPHPPTRRSIVGPGRRLR
jgi:hypothetical protein